MQETQETCAQSLGCRKGLLEKEMATHSSMLAWEILWVEEPGGIQSMGLQGQTLLSNGAHQNSEQCLT